MEGYTSKEAKKIQDKIEKLGWEVVINNLDAVKKDDSIYWYEYDDYAPILLLEKRTKDGKKFKIEMETEGDIYIYDKKDEENHFIFNGGKADLGDKDELTDDLVKNGVYENNNWFIIDGYKLNKKTKLYDRFPDKSNVLFSDFEDVEHSLKDAVAKVFEKIKEVDSEIAKNKK
jgi:hypothetical protein